MAQPTFYGMDPGQEYSYGTWELFRCCLLRALFSYNGKTFDEGGSEPQPDLATSQPTISADGLVWTFHLRHGLHYAPPLAATEITSQDIARALLRAGDRRAANEGLASIYLSLIQGFADYQKGTASTISGVETPDRYTLRIHETRPDGALSFALALPITAPVPPSPRDPGIRFGVAEGHNWNGDFDHPKGYGQFLVSSGPYMFEGSPDLDFSAPSKEQAPVEGFKAARLKDFDLRTPGSMTLVRNPSWRPENDPLRQASPDRIEIQIGGPGDLWAKVTDGTLDMVFDAVPPQEVLHRYESDPKLEPLIESAGGLGEAYAMFKVAQPPFDDVAVRRAVSLALDRASILAVAKKVGFRGQGNAPTIVAKHLAPDPSEGGLLADFDPFSLGGDEDNLQAARVELAHSRYARGGRCVASECRGVEVLVLRDLAPAVASIRQSLEALGIRGRVSSPDDFYDRCDDPRDHTGICVGTNWFADVPDAGNFLRTFFHSDSDLNSSLLGATPDQLRRWGYQIRHVPTADPDLDRCSIQVGSARTTCWAELDQKLMTEIVPAVPLLYLEPVRVISPRIRQFVWDQAYAQPALDRLVVAASS